MNKVEITGVNTSRLKTLPESEKTRLLLLARQGDPAARGTAGERESPAGAECGAEVRRTQ